MNGTNMTKPVFTGKADDKIVFKLKGYCWEEIVVFRANGTGYIDPGYDDYSWEESPFTHDLDLLTLQYQFPNQEQFEDYLTLYFLEYVNPTLPSPYLKDRFDLEEHELEFVVGNAEEFNQLMELFILTEPELEKAARLEIVIRCGTQTIPPLLSHELSYGSKRLDKLIQLAFKEHQPTGYTFEYNDNSRGKRSSYDQLPTELTYNLEEYLQAPARAKMGARSKLREWLLERGEDPAEYALQNWEKIV